MKIFVVVLLCCAAVASAQKGKAKSTGGAVKYVWDLLKPALNAAEVQALLVKEAGQWPSISGLPADLTFDCSNKKGFYADEKYQCQVFHRCDINGNLTSFLCVNTTVFNQITLVCDYWFNVECGRSGEFQDFANSRLYTEQDLFDSPPADYVAPQSAGSAADAQSVAKPSPTKSVQPAKPAPKQPVVAPKPPAPVPKAPVKPVVKPGPVKVGGSASVSAVSRQDEEVSASASANESASNVEATTAAAGETTAAAEEATTAAAEETTAAAE